MPEDYPPKHHMLSDLRIAIRREAAEAVTVSAPAVPQIFGRDGSVGAAALAVAVDVLGGNLSLEAVEPDWCVTSTLELHRLRRLTRDFEVSGAPLRAGRTSVVLDVAVHEPGSSEPGAVASMTFTRIPRRPDTPPLREPEGGHYVFGDGESVLAAPFLDALGIVVRDAEEGIVEIALRDYVRNSVGALQGGAVVALADAAAEAVAGARMAPGVATRDVQIHFLALGRRGPIRTRARWLAGDAREARLRVDLFDAGEGDRRVALATVGLGIL